MCMDGAALACHPPALPAARAGALRFGGAHLKAIRASAQMQSQVRHSSPARLATDLVGCVVAGIITSGCCPPSCSSVLCGWLLQDLLSTLMQGVQDTTAEDMLLTARSAGGAGSAGNKAAAAATSGGTPLSRFLSESALRDKQLMAEQERAATAIKARQQRQQAKTCGCFGF